MYLAMLLCFTIGCLFQVSIINLSPVFQKLLYRLRYDVPSVKTAPVLLDLPKVGIVDGTDRTNSYPQGTPHALATNSPLLTNCPLGSPGLVGLRDVLSKMPNGDILFSYGNRGYLPHHLHWVCNTAGWPGVHERTLLVVNDQFSKDAINRMSQNVWTYILSSDSQHHGFYSKGYRKLTIKRVEILIEVLKSGRGVVMFEGDALWTRNILEDPNLGGANRSHDAAFYRDGVTGDIIGAGISCFLCSLGYMICC